MSALAFDTDLDLGRMRRDRWARLVDAMRANGLDAVLLLGQSNVTYATGARVPSADQGRALHRRPVSLVTANGELPHLWTWCVEGAPADLPREHVHPGASLDTDAGAHELLEAVRVLLPPGCGLAVDELTMPLRRALLDAGDTVVDAGPAVGLAKLRKTADEIECVRRAQAINEAAITELLPMVRPGTLATELTGRFLRSILELGATWNNVDPIWQVMPAAIAEGPYSATGGVVFPTVTTARPLEHGDVVWVDNGLSFQGYMSDYGHTWVVGEAPSPRRRDQARRWRDVVAATLSATKPGATARDLTRAAVSATGRATRPWLPHLYLAHGSGTESAEPPFVGTDLGDDFDETVVLESGMVIVFEPVIWDEGHAGFRAEQVVTVTDDGWASLSDLTWDDWE